jgi:hypothetical protein
MLPEHTYCCKKIDITWGPGGRSFPTWPVRLSRPDDGRDRWWMLGVKHIAALLNTSPCNTVRDVFSTYTFLHSVS